MVPAEPGPAVLHAELLAAAQALRGQIERQNAVRYSRSGGQGGDDLAVRLLQSQLDEIEDILATLDPPAP